MKKLIGTLILVLLITTMLTPVLATENAIDYTKETKTIAEIDLSNDSINFGLFDDYNVYADKWWIMDGYVGVGAEGYTNIVEKKDGSYRYHYSNVVVYADSKEEFAYESGREWGEGKVYASTGNVGHGAMHHHRIFYGW